MTRTHKKAIALLSGGLDSMLAARIVKDLGIEVVGLHLLSPFGCREEVVKCAENLGIPLVIKEKGPAYLDLVENPRYGYGKNMNPCIDCRIFMFQLADVVRQDQNADFIVTGEVMGQRPMSQQKHSMELIDRKSPLEGRIVRPLSAHCLPPSVPELEGWIDREKLFDISGRSRKEQLRLAEELKLTGYSSPGGGCLLTESAFSARLRDFFGHKLYQSDEERLAQSEMLRLGRHFRLSEETKVIVSRNEIENNELTRLFSKANGILFSPDNFDGPVAVSFGTLNTEMKEIIGSLISRYGKGKENRLIKSSNEAGPFPAPEPIAQERLEALRL